MAKKNPWYIATFVLIGVLVLGLITGFIVFGSNDNGGSVGGVIGYDDFNKDVKTFTLDESWSGFSLVDARPDRCYSTGGVSESKYKCYLSVVNNLVWQVPSNAPDSFVSGKVTCTCLEK